jgi:hypothetical protein
MFETLRLNSWVNVSEGCAMRCSVSDTDSAYFVLGTGATEFEFEFAFDAEALRGFITLATQALEEMDHRDALEETGEPVPDDVTKLALTGQAGR